MANIAPATTTPTSARTAKAIPAFLPALEPLISWWVFGRFLPAWTLGSGLPAAWLRILTKSLISPSVSDSVSVSVSVSELVSESVSDDSVEVSSSLSMSVSESSWLSGASRKVCLSGALRCPPAVLRALAASETRHSAVKRIFNDDDNKMEEQHCFPAM